MIWPFSELFQDDRLALWGIINIFLIMVVESLGRFESVLKLLRVLNGQRKKFP